MSLPTTLVAVHVVGRGGHSPLQYGAPPCHTLSARPDPAGAQRGKTAPTLAHPRSRLHSSARSERGLLVRVLEGPFSERPHHRYLERWREIRRDQHTALLDLIRCPNSSILATSPWGPWMAASQSWPPTVRVFHNYCGVLVAPGSCRRVARLRAAILALRAPVEGHLPRIGRAPSGVQHALDSGPSHGDSPVRDASGPRSRKRPAVLRHLPKACACLLLAIRPGCASTRCPPLAARRRRRAWRDGGRLFDRGSRRARVDKGLRCKVFRKGWIHSPTPVLRSLH